MGMLESTHGEQVCKYNHVIGLYTMFKISGIKNFNTLVSKYPNIRTFYYAYVLLFTRFVAMFITRIRLRRKYNVYIYIYIIYTFLCSVKRIGSV